MGKNWDKFILLMWKNWTLQYRKPIQTIIEIAAPVLFSILLVVIRSLVDPELKGPIVYPPFCTIPIPQNNTLGFNPCPSYNDSGTNNGKLPQNSSLWQKNVVYSPDTPQTREIMSFFGRIFHVVALRNQEELENYFVTNGENKTLAGIQFPDNYASKDISNLMDLSVSIRFPGETRLALDPFGINNWRTNLIYPVFQTPGPRMPDTITGAAPSYYSEGFLAAQQLLTYSLILWRNGVGNNTDDVINWWKDHPLPLITMRRFAYGKWYEDILLTALKSMLGTIIMLSFVYTCINTVKSITTEKEKQLKESMKIMGLPNWLHWTAWFLKCFVFLLISVILMVVLLKVKWYSNTNYTVFTHSNPLVLLLFLILYICATITFCFALSVFFSKANTASTVAGLAWFLQFFPFLVMQERYDILSLSTKLLASLCSNSAMGFGFQIMLMYEGTGEGLQWSNIFTPNSPDDTFTLGHVMVMLVADTLIYLLIALYVEAIFPGEYGVSQPWYFPVTSTYWCGQSKYTSVEDSSVDNQVFESEFFEKEPQSLHVGVQIRNLRKVFGSMAAVRNLSLNMYENQITVLLGHNGAGKTTTMSMLTGMYTPTSGTAKINGFDIRSNMAGVRDSLGLCPQHNIIFDDLTVAEHLYFFSKLKGLSGSRIKEEIDKYVDLLELQAKRNAKSSTLSGGMKRKLCVGMALCGNSKVVMLDEPTAGMDPSARRALWNLLQEQKEGRTMLLTTHFMDEADLLGDRIAIMAGGELQCCGSSFFLKKKYGAGYSLIMDKSKECDAGRVTHILRRHIPDIEIHSNVGSELTYLLAESQSAVFERMLSDLEEHCKDLGVRSYGISLTTLEEVFMKVGADHGQEELYNDGLDVAKNINKSPISNGDLRVKIDASPSMSSGMKLVLNHFRAMFLKKYLATVRSWVLFIIQIIIPSLFVIISIIIARNQKRTGNLPAMPLDLGKFSSPITFVEKDAGDDTYLVGFQKFASDLGYSTTKNDNITEEMIHLTETVPNTVRRKYIVGASFDEDELLILKFPKITAWFNNDPYHSPAISLGMVLNTIYRQFGCPDCVLNFINHPLPYTASTQITQIINGQSMGFQIAFNVGFSMAFVSSFYLLFIVRENVCKSKHLQMVSGVKIWVFWVSHFICDMITYLITVLGFLIALASFQEDGFKTAEDIGRVFVIFLYFGWSFLPLYYLAGYFFDVPSTGYTRMTLFSIFTGNAAFLVVQILSNEALKLSHISKALHWVFLWVPHYSLAAGVNDNYKQYSFNYICNNLFEVCIKNGGTKEECIISMNNPQFEAICKDIDDNYYKWSAPGIGRNLVFSITEGAVLFAILLMKEYELFSRIMYWIEQKYFQKYPVTVENEDSDVVDQKRSIQNSSEYQIKSNYILAIKDLTKYYKKFLAVNGLSLGVKKYECFGLLGINGAGKTTTFKMMSGDEKISYGDGWVNGYSIKNQLKEIQKFVGYCPQFDALLDDMTANETIRMFCLLRGIQWRDADIVAEYLSKEFDFTRHLHKKVKEMSGGNKRKLSTAISLIGNPPVLFLDEPTTGMDPATKRYLWNALCKLRDNGKCIVLTSHSMEECEALCTRLAIMVNGNFKCLGSTQHLKNKFAAGYTLTIKVKKLPESSGLQHSETAAIEDFVKQHFPSAELRERHQELITYYITDTSVSWSRMFGLLEQAKTQNTNIEDYSLGQSSLEQVFLTFTKYQN